MTNRMRLTASSRTGEIKRYDILQFVESMNSNSKSNENDHQNK